MGNINISQIKESLTKYLSPIKEYLVNNLPLIIKETIDWNKEKVNNVITYNKPPVKDMISMLERYNSKLLEWHQKNFKKQEKIKIFEEYMCTKYGQMWESLSERTKEKEWPYWEYYSDWKWINQKWDKVRYDIFREWGDIEKYCKDNNITDFKFLWWGFNQSVE